MAPLLRFTMIEIDSKVCFKGKKKRPLSYCVCSLALVVTGAKKKDRLACLPEIFWQ